MMVAMHVTWHYYYNTTIEILQFILLIHKLTLCGTIKLMIGGHHRNETTVKKD